MDNEKWRGLLMLKTSLSRNEISQAGLTLESLSALAWDKGNLST